MISSLFDVKSIKNYLQRIGAEPRSLRSAVVKEQHGSYWKDVAVITFSTSGAVKAPHHLMPTENEAAMIAAECSSVVWPELRKLPKLTLPEELKKVDPSSIFTFYDEADQVIMLQQRIERKGEKSYVPWTYWTDGQWRMMEPEGQLPLWGIEQLKNQSTVFIHEGAKAASKVRWMVEGKTPEAKEALLNHPWGEELANAAHVGWIGGALSPARTDWSVIQRQGIKRAYIVSDNDEAGVTAVSAISFRLRTQTFHIQFTNEWPVSFDLADEFPKKMFSVIGGMKHYNGPSMRSCMHPATWATDQLTVPGENGRAKTITVLRDEFKKMWAYVEEADVFVCTEMPEIVRTEQVMDKMVAGFSHVKNTGQIMVKSYKGRSTRLCYRPDNKGRMITDRTTSAINLHQPTTIKAVKGDASPWMEFLNYMFPNPAECKDMQRWCATLIARPEIRMEYGILLVSETQGIGKTTLASKVLAPLVGDTNVGFPTEDEIVNSNFNGWLANKRLVVVGEIYSGHSWKAYNKLKSYITDKDIEVNQKYMRPYRVENWAHVVASSNSRKALKMEQSDRRWFYPQVTEEPWPTKKFGEFHAWLSNGGLQIIHHWAKTFNDYVSSGERAPSTALKTELINESRSEAQQELSDLCEAVNNEGKEVFCAMKEVVGWLRTKTEGRIFDKDYELRKIAQGLGWWTWPERVKVGSQTQTVIGSPATRRLEKEFQNADDEGRKLVREKMRKLLISPAKMDESSM